MLKSYHVFYLQGQWRRRLSRKFRNSRMTTGKEVDAPVQKPARQPSNTPQQASATTAGRNWSVDYCPTGEVEGEDASSIEIHHATILQEHRKSPGSRNYNALAFAMDGTFSQRRRFIVVEEKSIKAIKEVYPVLFEAEQVSHLASFFLLFFLVYEQI